MQNLRLIALLLLSLVLGSPLHQASGSGSNRSGGVAALTREEALMLAFPKCKIEKQTVYLTKNQKAMASKLAKAKVNRNIVYVYEARRDGRLVGSAYFDAHVVRTKKEIVMFVLDLKDRIDRIELHLHALGQVQVGVLEHERAGRLARDLEALLQHVGHADLAELE